MRKDCVNKYENFKIEDFDSDQKLKISDMNKIVPARILIARGMEFAASVSLITEEERRSQIV